jgi:hypothetical protein
MASDEFYQISCPWRRQWFVFDSLILSLGDTASQILRMLPKLVELGRDDSPMSFDELSAVSKNLVSLGCSKGFDFDTAQVDISSLIIPRLERVAVDSENNHDLQFITTVLENSIHRGRGFLKSLVLRSLLSTQPTSNSSVDYVQLITSLIKIIKVRILLSLMKASPEIKELFLSLIGDPASVTLDSCLDIFVGLDQIKKKIIWNQMSLDKIKSSLRNQGMKK